MRSSRRVAAVRFLRANGAFAVLACVVALLLAMTVSLAVRSGLLGFSGSLDSKQFGAFLAFIGASMGTAATVFAALLTRDHNARESRRLRLETVIKSLESLPPDASRPRLAGVLSTMVLLGQQRVAIRVLKPAWDAGHVDGGTATWLIGQVLAGSTPGTARGEEHADESAVHEAAALLLIGAKRLTEDEPRHYHFPGQFMSRWTAERELPREVKDHLLLAIGHMLVARDVSWWCPDGEPPHWPTNVLRDCLRTESVPVIRYSAAVLLAALHDRFRQKFEQYLPADEVKSIVECAAAGADDVPGEYLVIAEHLRNGWERRVDRRDEVVVAGA